MFEAISQFVKGFVKWTHGVFANYGNLLNVASVIACILLISYVVYSFSFAKRFTLLAGPDDSSGSVYAKEIADAFPSQFTGVGEHVNSINVLKTDGFEENRERVSKDSSGKFIGFAHDGFGDSTNVRMLLPLDRTYLHIIASRKFFEKIKLNCGCDPKDGVSYIPADLNMFNLVQFLKEKGNLVNPAQAQLGGVIKGTPGVFQNFQRRSASGSDELIMPRIAIGPKRSGTRQIALEVLKHYGLEKNFNFIEHHVENWRGIPNFLSQGTVDVVFYLGPQNSEFVQQIANENSSFLVGLGDDAKAIEKRFPNPLQSDKFPAYHYGRGKHLLQTSELELPNQLSKSTSPEGIQLPRQKVAEPRHFCSKEISVLSTQRVLICSNEMSRNDGYLIAKCARDSLSERIPVLRWNVEKNIPSNKEQYSYMLHPGAELLRSDGKPDWTFDFLTKIGLSLLIPVVIGLITWSARNGAEFFGATNFEKLSDEISEVGRDIDTLENEEYSFSRLTNAIAQLGNIMNKVEKGHRDKYLNLEQKQTLQDASDFIRERGERLVRFQGRVEQAIDSEVLQERIDNVCRDVEDAEKEEYSFAIISSLLVGLVGISEEIEKGFQENRLSAEDKRELTNATVSLGERVERLMLAGGGVDQPANFGMFQEQLDEITDAIVAMEENGFSIGKASFELVELERISAELTQVHHDGVLTDRERRELAELVDELRARIEQLVTDSGENTERFVDEGAVPLKNPRVSKGKSEDGQTTIQTMEQPASRPTVSEVTTANVLLASIGATAEALDSDLPAASLPKRRYEFFENQVRGFEEKLLTAEDSGWTVSEITILQAELNSLKSKFDQYRKR